MGHRTTKTNHKVKVHKTVLCRIDFFYYAFRNVLLVSAPLLVLSALILGFSIPHSSATNSGSDSVTLTLSTSCTLSSSVITPHHASLNGGQYEEGIGNTRINTYCNDNNGYSIYAIGTSNDMDGNTDLVSNLDEHYNIHTGAYVDGDNIDTSTPSFWGMKLIPGIGTGSSSELTPPTIMNSYNSYNVIPSSYTLVASRTSGTNMTIDTNITGSYFNTTYNIYASSVQPAGSYEGKVKYVMIHPHRNNNNIGFNEAFALSGKPSVGSHYAMQDMTSDICSMVNIYDEPSQTQLIDKRDGKTYWVAKLRDEHCWMTQNLDLDLSPSTTLTSNDTDLNDSSMTGAYGKDYSYDATNNVISWTPQNTTRDYQAETGTVWGNDNNVAYSIDPGEWYWDGDDSTPNCNYLNASAGCTHFAQDRINANRHLSVGNFYNWSAAIASDDSSSLTNSTYGDANSDPNATDRNPQNSICPKGWRLPTISYQGNIVNSTSEFARVNGLYNDGITNNDKKLIASPLWFVRSGGVNNGNLNSPGYEAVYWSSTVYSSLNAYHLDFMATNVDPAYNYGRRSGWSVRCVAR